jgi:GAF domain-containing protein
MADELPPLLEAVLGVGTDLELRTTLRQIVEGAAELTGARQAVLVARDPHRDGLTDIRTAGPPDVPPAPCSLVVPVRVRDEEFGELRLTDKRDRGPFTAEDEQLVRLLASQSGAAIGNARLYEAARRRERWVEGMLLPLEAGGRLIGTLALSRGRGARPYTAVERHLATQFASQATLALVLADARRGRQRLVVYEDRDRIARDLHDLVVQRLFATGMMLESTQRRSPPGDVHDMLGRAVDELQSTVQEVRTAIFALQQSPADAPTSLRGRVLRETASAAALLGFPPSTHFTGPVDNRVPDEIAARLLTALRRALADASRRRDVTRVEVAVDATTTLPTAATRYG